MPRYFFDVYDRGRRLRDDIGMDLSDEGSAIHEASLIIWQLLENARAEDRPGPVKVGIRTATGACLYETSTSADGG